MKQIPPIGSIMTPVVHTFELTSLAKDVLSALQELGFNHCPVTESGTLIGIVSKHDLRNCEEAQTIGEVCSRPVCTVDESCRTDEVLKFIEKKVL